MTEVTAFSPFAATKQMVVGQAKTCRLSAELRDALAVVILTKNEIDNIARCIEHIPDGLNITVVDCGSADGTQAAAKAIGAHVIETHWRGFAGQRNFAMSQLPETVSWVVFIDADEIFPPEFWASLDLAKMTDDGVDVYLVDQRLYLNTRKLRFAPGYPFYHPRLVRKGPRIFVPGPAGHDERPAPGLNIGKIDTPYLHDWHSGALTAWMDKHRVLAATRVAALKQPEHGQGNRRGKLGRAIPLGFWTPPLRFLYHYILRLGFLDGRAGLQYSLMMAWYEMTCYLLKVSSDDS
ncbi:MAG: glycosyltransferase family 2 protein [Pseudomonadota bacterium]